MVYRIFVEKKKALANEAAALASDIRNLLRIEGLQDLRLLNRYDVENIDEELFAYATATVFSEPQLDIVTTQLEQDGARVFAVEYLPGQFDQRADSAAQCIQIISQGERPLVRTARVYLLYGDLSDADVEAVKKYVINPVESREASLEPVETLATAYDVPTTVAVLDGFCTLDRTGLERFVTQYGLAMDADDIAFCQKYFISENRDPTITEIRMIDTYWSDHCRHTTFLTTIDRVEFEDELLRSAYEDYLAARRSTAVQSRCNLMDIANIGHAGVKGTGKIAEFG